MPTIIALVFLGASVAAATQPVVHAAESARCGGVLLVVICVFVVNLFGDSLPDALDPKLSTDRLFMRV